MTQRTFTADDQLQFAALSGDFNPLHVDPVRARRLMFGACAVHGVHTLLWCLDVWAARSSAPFALTSLKATFAKPVRVGDAVEFSIRKEDDSKARLQVAAGGEVVLRLDIGWAGADGPGPEIPARVFEPAEPVELQTYEDRTGQLPLALDPTLARRLLPHLADRMAPEQIAVLLASTRLVGMECPGLHSVYSGLDLAFDGSRASGPLDWTVTETDPRFSMLTMRLAGRGVEGEIRAFVRPAPRRQKDFTAMRALVSPDAFAGHRALVVGGSRGLGEVVAKLLAAGGAEVRVTWRHGREEAEALAAEINAGGGVAECAPFDVLEPGDADLVAWAPTHLYYFATPFIATGPKGGFSQPLFERFCAYYVAGLAGTVKLFGGSLRAVFNPSSVFVEEVPDILVEYAAAKAAGEFMCDYLARSKGPDFRVDRPRLPKMDTDQTASLSEGEEADPTPVMLEHLQTFVRP